ncbi:hypothetical protein PBI_SUFFOLK_64 [Mycobacterium phage Suffolk]|uniref:Uncharacterized protein n=3 Tax=Pegunavirus suffolk TaxID=1986540 RepID=V5UQM4_9CAUD|nr:hypothetical protein PBI_SUFFOLK_64 [Mycobacterium phage Suffolk]YP_009191058.1 hypothetical protein AU159_gp064 [Mycobacterium phage Colbert]ACU41210.1 hypothetical protein COLBERT_64 [Mycobacterium phage Colbert]AHB79700.1 hypothetical protein PBI_SUFFOLK_64 [Mycobacterium phage Suffolk]
MVLTRVVGSVSDPRATLPRHPTVWVAFLMETMRTIMTLTHRLSMYVGAWVDAWGGMDLAGHPGNAVGLARLYG